MASYKKPPVFGDKAYERYVEELRGWAMVTDLDAKKQAVAVALSFEENDPRQIRDKIFSELKLEDLNKEDGMVTLITFLDKLYKKDPLTNVYEHYVNFDRFKRQSNVTMENYILEFEKLYNLAKKHTVIMPEIVLALKLLDGAQLEYKDRQLVLTGVDYDKQNELFGHH